MIEVGKKVRVKTNLSEDETGIGNIKEYVGNEYTIRNIEYCEGKADYVILEGVEKWVWDLDWLEY